MYMLFFCGINSNSFLEHDHLGLSCDDFALRFINIFVNIICSFFKIVNGKTRTQTCPVNWFSSELRSMRETLIALKIICDSTNEEQA